MIERVNSTTTYCKNFCKCHNVSPAQEQYDNKKTKQNKKTNSKPLKKKKSSRRVWVTYQDSISEKKKKDWVQIWDMRIITIKKKCPIRKKNSHIYNEFKYKHLNKQGASFHKSMNNI
jgi:hypothetical protein